MRKSLKQSKKITVRSSAAEYLMFASAAGEQESAIELRYEDENLWLSQRLMAELYGVDIRTVSEHLKNLFSDSELDEDSVIRNFRITAADGKKYKTKHYNLQAIIAVGFKVGNSRAVQFRKWAGAIVKEFTIKGFVMDDERLRNGGTILTKQFFNELLERIREIRLSERQFYQKITDIYATAIDYDSTAQTTKKFFAMVQNKLHWAIHGHTAAEVIMHRANAKKAHMGLTSWKDAPKGKIQKFDVSVAKNYLTETELASLERLVSAYLDLAEDMAMRNISMTMADWATRLDRFIQATDREVLGDAGKVSQEIAHKFAETEFEKYRIVQDNLFESDFDIFIQNEQRGEKAGEEIRKVNLIGNRKNELRKSIDEVVEDGEGAK